MGRMMILMGAVLLAQPASANWQYTKWGQSVAEVRAASAGAAQPVDQPGRNGTGFKTLLEAPYKALGYEFIASFRFSAATGELIAVQLEPVVRDCPGLRVKLVAIYGDAYNRTRSAIYSLEQWRDDAGGNLVDFLDIGGKCDISYRPIIKKGSGL